jgi:hypothetical protein
MHFTVMCVWFLVPAVAEWEASLRATHGTTRSLCSSQPRVCSAWEISSTVVSVAALAFQVSHCKGSSCHVPFLPFLQCAPRPCASWLIMLRLPIAVYVLNVASVTAGWTKCSTYSTCQTRCHNCSISMMLSSDVALPLLRTLSWQCVLTTILLSRK